MADVGRLSGPVVRVLVMVEVGRVVGTVPVVLGLDRMVLGPPVEVVPSRLVVVDGAVEVTVIVLPLGVLTDEAVLGLEVAGATGESVVVI